MQRVEQRAAPITNQSTGSAYRHQLIKISHQWDSRIRHQLQRFAQDHWHGVHLMGLIPVHSFRTRRQLVGGKIIWWVEHDIPPYDRYRCEAFQVELSLTRADQPRLLVRTGSAAYQVAPLNLEGLRAALQRAGKDKPLITHRQFGLARD